jgi:hypothetical protein
MGLKLLLAGAVLFASIAYVHMLQNRPHVLRGGEEVGHRGGIVVKKETQLGEAEMDVLPKKV